MNTNEYFKNLEREVKKVYEIANEARAKGLDPIDKVEIPLARSLAEKVVGLISTIYPQIENSGIVERILELEKVYEKLDVAVAFKVAEEIAKQKFCKFASLLEAIDAGIRIGFAYITLGVVSSPIEGFTELKLGRTKNGREYFIAYFSGPIRSAGTTASCVVLMLIDYLRELFGYEKYDAREEEVKRYVAENTDYHERISNLQYFPTEQEMIFLAKNLPIQIDGDPTEKLEVSNYKNLDRVGTNFIRGGMCLIFSEGLAQKAKKGLRLLKGLKDKGFKSTGWDFLENYVKLHEKRDTGETEDAPTYIKDLVAGRPIFGHPSRSGTFRFRYGRGRVSGFSASSLHPATMAITDNFIATGTQLKTEKPIKGTVTTVCDSIEGPIVKLFNGSVKKPKTKEEARKLYPDVEEIIYLGDILFSFGDLANRNFQLLKQGYVEEWWKLELREKNPELEKQIDCFNIEFEKAVEISKEYGIPLHPNFIFYWTEISRQQFLNLLEWLKHSRVNKKIILPYTSSDREKFESGKRALELLGAEHEVVIENVVLNEKNSKALLANLGLDWKILENEEEFSLKEIINEYEERVGVVINKLNTLEDIEDKGKYSILYILNNEQIRNSVSNFEIKDKAGEFIGARMGRPEKAKLRKLTGSPNVLFPVGREGGRLRSVEAACEAGKVTSAFPIYYCEKCKTETIYFICERCNEKCKKLYYCVECNKKSFNVCREHKKSQSYRNIDLDIVHYFEDARKKLMFSKEELPILIKGIRGTSSENHFIEHLAKGILRAMYNLQVNKDGTIRFDATELPLVSFKAKEISTSIEKLRELGYDKDIFGKEIVDENQIIELMPHDIVLPSSSESLDERADNVFVKVAQFIDELLVRFYNLKPFYNVKKREDLIGKLGVCMAPHNCAGVICRFIGFSNTLGLLASPYMHAAIRRDCVYPSTKTFFYDENTKEIFYEGIGDYIERLIKEGAEIKKIDSFGTLAIKNNKNLYTFGIDPITHNLKRKKIKYFIKGPKTKEWIKIITATNREYIMTPTHKFMYIENGNFKFKEAKNVEVDDKLPVLENFNFNLEVKNLDLIKLFKEKLSEDEQKEILVINNKKKISLDKFGNFEENNSMLMLRHKFSKHILPAVLEIDKNLMRILGYYASEGYSRTNKWVSQVSFRICDKEMQSHINDLIKKIFGIKANLGEDDSKITVCSKLVYYLFKSFGAGKGAYDKRVPSFIFGLDKELVKEYVSAYFEGDGSVIKNKKIIAFYSVSRDLLDDVALLLTKFKILCRYFRTEFRLPGKKVLERYKELEKEPKKHILNHLVLGVYDSFELSKILNLVNKRKLEDLSYLKEAEKRYLNYNKKQILLEAKSDYVEDYVKKVEIIKEEKNSYCIEIDWKELEDRNVLWGEQIINTRCDGDEAAIMLLGDVLLNFSREFLPSHRGGAQDAPLVLNAKIDAGEVDSEVLDFELTYEYPIELYRLAEKREHSSKVQIENIRSVLKKGKNPFIDLGFTHDTSNFNDGVVCSSYKLLSTMQEKVQHQMKLVEKIRAVDTSDTARLIIERHFLKDLRGNLRKFSRQDFRCVVCNEIMRRPPLNGVCSNCNGKIIFTVNEGGIKKYLEAALDLANKYNLSTYIKQNLELTKRYIETIFGRELEQQEVLKKWF